MKFGAKYELVRGFGKGINMTKNYIVGRLGYNSQNDRYGLLVSDLWEHTGFHCGESLEIMINGEWVHTCMEMSLDKKWYLVDTPYFDNLENIQARIEG